MKPRICFVFSTFPPVAMGGVQKYLLTISQELSRRGIHPTILTRYYPTLSKREKFPTHSVERIGFNPIPFSHNKRVNSITTKLGDLLTYSLLGYPEARKEASRSMVVHSQFAILSDVKLAHRIARESKRKHVVTVHIRFGNKTEDFPPSADAFRLLRETDYIIVNRRSSFALLKHLGIGNVSLLTNPISCDLYRPPKNQSKPSGNREATRILFVGRLVERRGPKLALDAFTRALKTNPNLEFYIVGAGIQEKTLKHQIKRSNLESKVKMVGEKDDVRPYLWMSDIFLAPSAVANSPSIALREAMAAGLAIVATDVEDTSKIVRDGETGLLSEVDSISIADCILRLSEKRSLLEKLGNGAMQYAWKNLDVTNYVDQLIGIYKTVVE